MSLSAKSKSFLARGILFNKFATTSIHNRSNKTRTNVAVG